MSQPGQFYSRVAAYNIQHHTPATLDSSTDTTTTKNNSSMTWQQEETFGAARNNQKGKGIHWTPLDISSTQDSQVIAPVDWVDSFGTFAQPSALGASSKEAIPKSKVTHEGNATGLQKKSHKNRRRQPAKQSPEQNSLKMSALPKSAFIPPHLRKSIVPPTAIEHIADQDVEKSETKANPEADLNHIIVKLQPSLPLSPPSTADPSNKESHEPVDTVKVGTTFDGWHATTPLPAPTDTRRRENSRWPRVPRKWPRASEMRAPTEDSEDDGGIQCQSDSEGDDMYDVKKLIDFNGEWLTPDPDWASRRGYKDRHFGRTIEKWMNGQPVELLKPMEFSIEEFSNSISEVVPHYWTLPMVEGKSLGEFWKDMPTCSPSALSNVDIHAEAPFWERHSGHAGCLLPVFDVPTANIDPNDFDNRHAGSLALASVEQRIMVKNERIEQRRLRKQVSHKRAVPAPVRVEPVHPDNKLVPAINMYIRPVQPTDVRGIAEIYNHYVEKTILAHEFEPYSEDYMRSHIDNITVQGLPFLVAVAKGNNRKNDRMQEYVTEKIVGFVSLDDLSDPRSMYRYTFDMDFYVHPGYQGYKIGSCLLDTILHIANTGYNARGGYVYENNFNYLNNGPRRTIKTINLTVYKENGQDDKDEAAWLKKYNFHRAGHFQRIGYKLGKVVDSFTFQHHTSEEIDPNSRPAALGTPWS